MAKTAKKTNNKTTRSGGQGEVRIIGGEWRGRKLPVLEADGLRPTSDRIRETLFNWLQFELPTAHCLDVFAGSGALGFEALSRGAAQVVMLEKSAVIAQQLKQNAGLLKTAKAEIHQSDSLQFLAKPASQTFKVVFVDPPFQQGLMQPTMDALFSQGWVSDQAWLYLEQEKSLDWPTLPEGWLIHREKTTSQVRLSLWHKPTLD